MANEFDEFLTRLHREFADKTLIVKAGWVGYRTMFGIDGEAVDEHRAFYAGAQHLFASIMTVLDEGAEPTDADLRRMDNIAAELKAFETVLESQVRKHGH